MCSSDLTRTAAETLALSALSWLLNDADNQEQFLAASGLDPATLRARASEPDLLLAVVDYVLAHEALASTFCDFVKTSSRELHLARHLLEDR